MWVNSNGGTSLGTNGTPPSRGLRVHGVSQFEDRVGIHTFVPGRQLHVRQTTTSSASSGITIERAPPSTNQWGLYVNTSDGLNLVYNNSTVGIFNPATGVYSATSDARLKTNLQPIGEVLDRVLALKPSSYHMNGQDDFAPRSIGLIAQQVEPLFPEIVTRMDDEGDLMGLRYSELSVLNVQAIIELNARLESNVAMLADENAELRERLAVLESLLLEQVPVVAETGR
ncbi:MAG: hypothetical protein EA418_12575 [Wenzhouxiangellaceae bacterium]|nr:MAG: hypothetical protein EA418_12575 [Wenzhouxiangellaceae bacterium]